MGKCAEIMWQRVANLILRNRFFVLGTITLITVFLGFYALNELKLDNKYGTILPKDSKEKTDYKQRKKLGVQTCLEFVSSDSRFKEWEHFFIKHTKKDDLSDCFLQGMWFIKHKQIIL